MASFGVRTTKCFWLVGLIMQLLYMMNITSFTVLAVWSVSGACEKSWLWLVSDGQCEKAMAIWDRAEKVLDKGLMITWNVMKSVWKKLKKLKAHCCGDKRGEDTIPLLPTTIHHI